MKHLLLVKHSLPEIIPAIPTKQWGLSEAGREHCAHHPSYQRLQAITFEPEPLQNRASSYIEKLEIPEA